MLRTRSGVLLSPFVITNAIEEVGGLAHYQVVQKLPGSFEVRVVATHGTPPFQIERDIKSVLSAAVANDADLIVNFVPKIAAPHGSHKVPLVISELPAAA